jgi:murein DD-endopeptidase MepM/ murein hydrolase activator NlpD
MSAVQRGGRFCLLLAAGALAATGCGGRASSGAVTSPEPPIADWQRPSRMSDAVPAVRLDPPDESAAGDAADEAEDAGPAGAGNVQVSLEPGMTLYSLARAYRVALPALMQANGITDPTRIPAGTMIVIPASPGPAPRARGRPPAAMSIAWPLSGRITAGFGQRGRHRHHAGVDIDGHTGEEVQAVAAGTVVASGSEAKYGRTVVIDHGSGLTTLYAHASRLLVHEGDRVRQGEAIAEVGASGNARGSHLHFEVRRNGRPVDPSPYLRSGSVPLPGARGASSAAPSSGSR